MKSYSLNQRNIGPARSCRGFTLLELMVVMAIIIFLVSITVVVVSAGLNSARAGATKATIRKIDGLLTKRMEAFTIAIDKQNQSTHPRYIYNDKLFPAAATPLSGDISPFVLASRNVLRAKVLGRKGLFRLGFPQTMGEIDYIDPSLRGGNTNTPSEADSSEAMYIFLTKMESFGLPAVDEDAFTSNEIGDTDGDGLKEFVDGWDRPIRFYRWPTRLIRPAPTATDTQAIQSMPPCPPAEPYTIPLQTQDYFGNAGYGASAFFANLPANLVTLRQDPDDPNEALNDTVASTFYLDTRKCRNHRCTWDYWVGSTKHTMTPTAFEAGFFLNTPDTWSMPLIISAGADGVTGIYEADDFPNYGHLAQPYTTVSELEGILDNITNRNLQP